jgi:2-amino-4-hydroxy-6-hydroxymethyldihydropteridine diphosphokinase
VRVFLGLGSNLGDRVGYLAGALDGLRRLDPDLECSPVYETAPVGGPAGQGPYLNCVVRLETVLAPRALLEATRRLEADAGRTRAEHWGARTLDVDVLLIDGEVIEDEVLVVPHPRLRERAFVLAPLEDLDPTRVPAGWRDALGGDAAVARLVRRVEPCPLP